jgi:hypothetical protein
LQLAAGAVQALTMHIDVSRLSHGLQQANGDFASLHAAACGKSLFFRPLLPHIFDISIKRHVRTVYDLQLIQIKVHKYMHMYVYTTKQLGHERCT